MSEQERERPIREGEPGSGGPGGSAGGFEGGGDTRAPVPDATEMSTGKVAECGEDEEFAGTTVYETSIGGSEESGAAGGTGSTGYSYREQG